MHAFQMYENSIYSIIFNSLCFDICEQPLNVTKLVNMHSGMPVGKPSTIQQSRLISHTSIESLSLPQAASTKSQLISHSLYDDRQLAYL